MNALLGSELIEILSLEKLVNQSRSLCHIVSTEQYALGDRRSRRGGNYTFFLPY